MSIDLMLKAFDYIIQLLSRREKIFEKRFNNLFLPIYGALEEINANYIKIYEDIYEILPSPFEKNKNIGQVCEKLKNARRIKSSERLEIVCLVEKIISTDNLSTKERDFLVSVMNYMKNGVLRPENKGNITRSQKLLDRLYQAAFLLEEDDAWKIISECIEENNYYWAIVSDKFFALKEEIK